MANVHNYLEYINDLAKNDPQALVARSETRFDNILNAVADRVENDSGREIIMLAGLLHRARRRPQKSSRKNARRAGCKRT